MGVDGAYFEWLCGQIQTNKLGRPAQTHWILAEQLHRKIFKPYVQNDDNRAADGKDLRWEYCSTFGLGDNQRDILRDPCTMLEMLVALARQMAYELDGLGHGYDVADCFWRMLDNLDLYQFNDEAYLNDGVDEISEIVDSIIDTLNERGYRPDGRGGLFPLRQPAQDQRKVELWYQMSQYLIENTDLGN